ncbi:MAG TPA: DUF433 domain-containing protein [Thermoanaerobaculia bacterium]|nr:DUF433 domain-containing protein [Thermoanaerobaculia bacterium]
MASQVRIVSTPGICGGKPRIDGHRIRVMDIVAAHERLGLATAEIAAAYSLTLAEVEAALAYSAEHPEEIRQEIALARQLVEELASQQPSPLQVKLGPHFRLWLDGDRLVLPAELRAHLGVPDSGLLIAYRWGSDVVALESSTRAIDRVQRRLENLAAAGEGHADGLPGDHRAPAGREIFPGLAATPSLSDELLAERHKEAQREEQEETHGTADDNLTRERR